MHLVIQSTNSKFLMHTHSIHHDITFQCSSFFCTSIMAGKYYLLPKKSSAVKVTPKGQGQHQRSVGLSLWLSA